MTFKHKLSKRLALMRDRVHHPASMRELLQVLRIPREERTAFKRHIKSLVSSGDLIQIRGHRFGLPLSWQWGVFHGKVGYEHTSAHLGDEAIRALHITNISGYRRDEAVVGLGRYFDPEVRVYGQIAYAFGRSIPQPLAPLPQLPKPDPWRFDVGAEWAPLAPTGLAGRPFVATNVQFRGDQDYKPNFNAQAGWMWHNPYQRLANFRLFVEYYNARSPYGYVFDTREHFYGIGMAGDF